MSPCVYGSDYSVAGVTRGVVALVQKSAMSPYCVRSFWLESRVVVVMHSSV